jgi:WD40 repeat protein
VWLWDLVTGVEEARLQGHTDYVWSLAFSPDGPTLVSGSGDNSESITVLNGLTLNGTVTLGSGSNYAALLFQGTQTLDGNATIVFRGSNQQYDALAVTAITARSPSAPT